MKKFNKSTAILLSVIMSIVLVVGIIFTFVPMKFGSKTWKSFSNTINISSDISGGLYGEFNIKTEDPSTDDVVKSLQKIREVFEQDGYKNVSVYAVGKEKIRVEAGYSKSGRTYAETYNKIASVGAGAFSLRSTYSVEESTISVLGKDAVKEVKVFTNNNINYISIVFNKEGTKQFEELCTKSSSSVYIALGDYAQQISIAGLTSYSEFTLSDDDYANLMELRDNIVIGCMKIELDSSSAKINTMSASLSAGESGSTLSDDSYYTSTALILLTVALASVAVLILAYFAVRFGFYALLVLVTLAFNACLFIILMNLMPSIEFGLSSFVVIAIGLSVIYTYALLYASVVKKEYNAGKSLNASLETAYKKSLPTVLISNIMLLIASLVFIAFAYGEIASAAIVFAVCAFLSLFTNLLLIPFLVKLCNSFGNFGFKLFMLKKRLDFSSHSNETADKEAE